MKTTFFAKIICLFALLIYSQNLYSQSSLLDKHYPGGKDGFWEKFNSNFNFPASSLKSQHYGTVLIKITLNSDGVPARFFFLTQIDVDILKAMLHSLTRQSHDWTGFPESSDLYLSFGFSYNRDYTEEIKIDKSLVNQEFAEFKYILDVPEQEAISYKKNYSKLLKEAKKAYSKSEFRKANTAYSRLISLNPYVLDFYLKRIDTEAFIGAKVHACSDIKIIKGLMDYKGSVPLHGCN